MQWTGHDTVTMVLHYAKTRMSDQFGFAEFVKLPPRGRFGEESKSAS
jgi:hypothetical protein